jgi:hypothetical protein
MYPYLSTAFAVDGGGRDIDLITVVEPPLYVSFQFFAIQIFLSPFSVFVAIGMGGVKSYISWVERF